MPVGKPLHIRLFLEGEEVPVISAQVSINTNAPASAAVQIVPLDEALDLKPRTMVHIFFLDSAADSEPNTSIGYNGSETGEETVAARGVYRLLFAGEAIGFSVIQTPQSRGTVLQCVDFSNYWDTAHATAIEYGPMGNLFTHEGALYGGDTSLFDDIVNYQQNKLADWIRQTPQTQGLTSVTGLAGGVIRVMEAVGGVVNHHKGINDFFTVAELRCRLLNQITAEEHDDTASRLLNEKVFIDWLMNGLQNMGQQVTFRDLMKLLFQYIYYEFVPNPTAKFDEAVTGTKTEQKTSEVNSITETTQGLVAKNSLESAQKRATGATTSSNVSDAGYVKELSINIRSDLNAADAALKSLAKQAKSATKGTSDVQGELVKALAAVDPITKATPKEPAKAFQGVSDAIAKVSKALLKIKGKFRQTSHATTTGTSQRLRTQIIRPDCWFSAPPKCNVIFPEMFSQLSYERNWIGECTRSLTYVFSSIDHIKDKLFAERYLAPNIGFDSAALVNFGASQSSYRTLMKHELHTGIVPRTESISNTFAVTYHKDPKSMLNVKSGRSDWASKMVLFNFFKYRFAGRSASIGGKFNPFVVCGFPGVILKTPFIPKDDTKAAASLTSTDLIQIQDLAKTQGAPYQLVGQIEGVSHSIDQSGGSTSISMHHVRRHAGIDDEFLNVLLNSEGTMKKVIKYSISRNYLKEVEDSNPTLYKELLTLLIKLTPQKDVIPPNVKPVVTKKVVKQIDNQTTTATADGTVTNRTLTSQVTEEHTFPSSSDKLVIDGKIEKVNVEGIKVPNPSGTLSNGMKGRYGDILGVAVNPSYNVFQMPGTEDLVYDAVTVYEEVTLPFQNWTAPIEWLLQPKWFSSAYFNENIGTKIYQPFFGCDSVVDAMRVNGSQQAVVSGWNDDATDVDLTQTSQQAIKALVDAEATKGLISIERAVTTLSYIYGKVKAQGLDVDEFIRSYTYRPIASITDIFGDPGLMFDINGSAVTPQKVELLTDDGKKELYTGKIGFHTMAVHRQVVEAGKLIGLTEDPQLHIPRANNAGFNGTVNDAYDVRKAKKLQVLRYIDALKMGRGFPG